MRTFVFLWNCDVIGNQTWPKLLMFRCDFDVMENLESSEKFGHLNTTFTSCWELRSVVHLQLQGAFAKPGRAHGAGRVTSSIDRPTSSGRRWGARPELATCMKAGWRHLVRDQIDPLYWKQQAGCHCSVTVGSVYLDSGRLASYDLMEWATSPSHHNVLLISMWQPLQFALLVCIYIYVCMYICHI